MSFDCGMYLLLNPDLEKLRLKTVHGYINHYNSIGKKEGRQYIFERVYPNFDYASYQQSQSLVNMNKRQLEEHYIKYGNKCNKKAKKTIYIVFSVSTGGSVKYINNLQYSCKYEILLINTKKMLYSIAFKKEDVILVQQLLKTDIRATDLSYLQKRYCFRMMICIHDFCWLNPDIYDLRTLHPHNVYLTKQVIMPEVMELFSLADTVIHPTQFSYDEYGKYMNISNFKVVPHIDYRYHWKRIMVPIVINEINIGVFHHKSSVKGSEYVSLLMNQYKAFGGKKIRYFVVQETIPVYKDNEYDMMISKYNIHGLLLLNKFGETWSYLLTKSLLTGLPLLYNNIGSHKYRIEPDEHRFSVGNQDGQIDLCKLWEKYEDMLTYIVSEGKQGKMVWQEGNEMAVPEFYTQL